MYNDAVFAQTKSETEAKYAAGEDEPICTLRVHSVQPDLDVPLLPGTEGVLKRSLVR